MLYFNSSRAETLKSKYRNLVEDPGFLAVASHVEFTSRIHCYSHNQQQFSRISANPEVMGGKPCIRGMRVTVGMIVEAHAYAANLAQGREFPLAR